MLRFFTLLACAMPVLSAELTTGPYNGVFIPSGLGLKKQLPASLPVDSTAPWTLQCWIKSAGSLPNRTLIMGIGDHDAGRYLAVLNGKLAFWAGGNNAVSSDALLDPQKWHHLAATFDGKSVTLFADGVSLNSKPLALSPAANSFELAPHILPWTDASHFAGKIAIATYSSGALTPSELSEIYDQRPQFDLINFEAGSKDWSVQTHAQAGYRAPQDPSTLPKSGAPFSKPRSKSPYSGPSVVARTSNEWALAGGWYLTPAPQVSADGAAISQRGFPVRGWFPATVPGTVLTTLIDRGVYPDPDYGLNNLAIPESLNKQDYWYRTEFVAPDQTVGKHLTLTFHGINYLATVWLNRQRLGTIKGAFIRGTFDVTSSILPGKPNVLAVRISPPPHPGIPQEQSVIAGPGENGGIMCLDGPTFIDTEGWDWIPAIRDRNTGIWQEVTLLATDSVKIGDPQVITSLPLPDISHSSVSITVPLSNNSNTEVSGTLYASFEGASISKAVVVPPGGASVSLTPAEFPRLDVSLPRLWWPNGYGLPELYHLNLKFSAAANQSDSRTLRFGIRQITYELSLLDKSGQLRRVEYSPVAAQGTPVVDISHEGIIETSRGWVYSLRADAESSPAIHFLEDTRLTPYLVIRVNGVRIACKGGNWGMDDSRKRVSREHLEPFFRLHRDAHLNIIRNWCGQSTEEVFYDLADEYGLLVWNDFWQSTQNYNVEPTDTALFLANLRDTVQRYRNHPSIAVWCGRNEGVPAPALNEAMDEAFRTLDGTRYYSPSSNTINLQNSGPYRYEAPVGFFTKFARGFAVELGIPSFPTLAAFRSFVPEADQWPPNDTWAYHDWHQSGNGVIAPFMETMEKQLGAPRNLADFERKAQLMNYDAHRAIFEGFNAGLWNTTSGRMLWMTQPAWPSTMWQILGADYDTQASFYGVQKAAEQVHVQLNLPDLTLAVVNNSAVAIPNASIQVQTFNQLGKPLGTRKVSVNVAPGGTTQLSSVEQPASNLFFVALTLNDSQNNVLARNFYWHANSEADYQQLNQIPSVELQATATSAIAGEESRATVQLTNNGLNVAIMTKLTLKRSENGMRILPAYYSDNYISLLPGETREIQIEYPTTAAHGDAMIDLTGWNAQPVSVKVSQ